jgi:hypothetical protein
VHENTDNKANKKKHDETDLKTLPEHNIKENTVQDLNQNVWMTPLSQVIP